MKKRTTGSDVPLCFELYEKSYTGLEQFSIVLKLIQISFVFALFRSVIGPEKLPSLSHPLRCKTNHAFVAHVFPRFKQFVFFFLVRVLIGFYYFLSFLPTGRWDYFGVCFFTKLNRKVPLTP